MKIVIKRVGEDPYVDEREELELEDMQELVGDYIECLHVGGNVDMWLNDEGKICRLPFNFILGDADTKKILDIIHGDVFFAACGDEGETIGLTDGEITWVMNKLNSGEFAVRKHGDSNVDFLPVWHFDPTVS